MDIVYEEAFRVRAYEAGAARVVSLPVLADYMQEAAGNHATALGFGMEALLDSGQTWMLSRMRVEVARYPRWGETVRVTTWPAGTSRLWALREFRLADESGEPFAIASTAWLLLDLARRRPLRPPVLIDDLSTRAPASSPPDLLDEVPALLAPEGAREMPIRLADTDVNRHANNVALLSLVLEAAPPAMLGAAMPAEAWLDFRAEAAYGDALLAEWQELPDGALRHRLSRRSDGREVVRAVTRWRAIG